MIVTRIMQAQMNQATSYRSSSPWCRSQRYSLNRKGSRRSLHRNDRRGSSPTTWSSSEPPTSGPFRGVLRPSRSGWEPVTWPWRRNNSPKAARRTAGPRGVADGRGLDISWGDRSEVAGESKKAKITCILFGIDMCLKGAKMAQTLT